MGISQVSAILVSMGSIVHAPYCPWGPIPGHVIWVHTDGHKAVDPRRIPARPSQLWFHTWWWTAFTNVIYLVQPFSTAWLNGWITHEHYMYAVVRCSPTSNLLTGSWITKQPWLFSNTLHTCYVEYGCVIVHYDLKSDPATIWDPIYIYTCCYWQS